MGHLAHRGKRGAGYGMESWSVSTFRLVVKEGKDAGRVFHLKGVEITLGRPGAEAETAIEFEEPTVSRVHAVLKWLEEEGCYELSNRSFLLPAQVDGQPAVSGTRLAHGSRIQLGQLVAEVEKSEPEAPKKEEEEEAPLMGCLEVVQGPLSPGTRFPVYRRRTVIGRGTECEIYLDAPSLARKHAVIQWYERLPELLPLTSRTILVNGQPIPRGTFLKPRDWVILDVEISLRWLTTRDLDREALKRQQRASMEVIPEPEPEPEPELPLSIAAPREVPKGYLATATLPSRAAFFTDLADLIDSGQPIGRAVETAATARLPLLARRLSDQMLGGQCLADAMARFPGAFAPFELGMVAAGEEAGILERQLRALAESLRATRELRSRLFAWLLPGLATLGLGFPLLLLRPVLAAQGPHAYGAAIAASMALLAMLFLALVGGRRTLTRSNAYLRWEEAFLDLLPLIGRALRTRAGARFLKALGALLAAGLQVQRAAFLAAGCTGSTRHTLALMEAAQLLEQGTPVLDALAPTGLMPPDILAEVEKGEEHGDLPERLASAAGLLDQATLRATKAAFPVVLGFLILLSGALALASSLLMRLLWL